MSKACALPRFAWRIVPTFVFLCLAAAASAADVPLSLKDAGARKPPDFSPLYEGRSVLVSGQVSAPPVHVPNFVHLAIQDRGHGLILETTGTMFDHLSPGDWVDAHGRIAGRWGVPVVVVSKIAVVSTGAPPLPVSLPLNAIQSLDRVGQLVIAEGPVIEAGSNFGGALVAIHCCSFPRLRWDRQGGTEDRPALTLGFPFVPIRPRSHPSHSFRSVPSFS